MRYLLKAIYELFDIFLFWNKESVYSLSFHRLRSIHNIVNKRKSSKWQRNHTLLKTQERLGRRTAEFEAGSTYSPFYGISLLPPYIEIEIYTREVPLGDFETWSSDTRYYLKVGFV